MKQSARRSSLFLMELIMAIGLFCIASAICVQIFVKSHKYERKSNELNHAVNLAVSTAEYFRNTEVSPYEEYYNEKWELCEETEAVYTLKLDVEAAKPFQIGRISIEAHNSSLYELEVLKNENTEVVD